MSQNATKTGKVIFQTICDKFLLPHLSYRENEQDKIVTVGLLEKSMEELSKVENVMKNHLEMTTVRNLISNDFSAKLEIILYNTKELILCYNLSNIFEIANDQDLIGVSPLEKFESYYLPQLPESLKTALMAPLKHLTRNHKSNLKKYLTSSKEKFFRLINNQCRIWSKQINEQNIKFTNEFLKKKLPQSEIDSICKNVINANLGNKITHTFTMRYKQMFSRVKMFVESYLCAEMRRLTSIEHANEITGSFHQFFENAY